jgi:hypothetical protein
MQEVVEYVLAGQLSPGWLRFRVDFRTDIVSQITELIVKPKNNKRVIIAIAVDGEEQSAPRDQGHSVRKVTLKTSKEDYVLDFSSAQFGYYEPVTTFGEYLEHRVQESIFPGGPPCLKHLHLGQTRHRLLKTCEENSVSGVIFRVHEDGHTYLKGGVCTWEKESKMKIKEMLLLEPDKFKVQLGHLSKCIAKLIDGFLLLLNERREKIKAEVAAGALKPGIVYG